MFKQKSVYPEQTKKSQFMQVILFGPLYSLVRKHKHDLFLRLHLSGDLYFRLPKQLLFRIYKKRLVVWGNQMNITNFLNFFSLLRKPNVYTGVRLEIRQNIRKMYYKKQGKITRR